MKAHPIHRFLSIFLLAGMIAVLMVGLMPAQPASAIDTGISGDIDTYYKGYPFDPEGQPFQVSLAYNQVMQSDKFELYFSPSGDVAEIGGLFSDWAALIPPSKMTVTGLSADDPALEIVDEDCKDQTYWYGFTPCHFYLKYTAPATTIENKKITVKIYWNDGTLYAEKKNKSWQSS